PFGSVLVSADGEVLFEDHNHVASGDHTQHPEFAIARWAAEHMSIEERKKATVYTSGEHCPMCAAARGWVALGRSVHARPPRQLVVWLGISPLEPWRQRVRNLGSEEVIRDTAGEGPVPELVERVNPLHRQPHCRQQD